MSATKFLKEILSWSLQVRVGRNLTYHIGFLRYEEPEGTSLHMVIGLAVGGAVLLMIVIIVVIAYRVKSKQSNTMKKQLHDQMDQLELKVAQECKEGNVFNFLVGFSLLIILYFSHIYLLVVWLLDAMNLGSWHIFPKYFQPLLEPPLGKWIMKWHTHWWGIYIYIESKRKNKCL